MPQAARPTTEELRARLLQTYRATRAATEALAAPLSAEDQLLQSMPDCSPTKWHRAHTTWFFETFLLAPRGLPVVDERYGYLFNSYYEAVGPRHARPKRGALSRPSAAEVTTYRRAVDERVERLLRDLDGDELARAAGVVDLGVAHEEQHQELVLTDILHAFSESPLRPAYAAPETKGRASLAPVARDGARVHAEPLRFVSFEGGLQEIGAAAHGSFVFDNESPRHKVWLEPFELADRLVTVGEMRAFVDAGGYRTPSLWLAEGFDFVRANDLRAPAYVDYADGVYRTFGLHGTRVVADDEPVAHVSYYEADAVARFLGARLPTEAEWEVAASRVSVDGTFVESRALRPLPAQPSSSNDARVRQLFGEGWQWTSSAYAPYPGYEPAAGALGEYNGKFMVSQLVLRGGSALSPRRHLRASYRNFWPPATRFQQTSIRLARSARA